MESCSRKRFKPIIQWVTYLLLHVTGAQFEPTHYQLSTPLYTVTLFYVWISVCNFNAIALFLDEVILKLNCQVLYTQSLLGNCMSLKQNYFLT